MSTEMFPLNRSDYLIWYLAEQEEIAKLKWIESEKAGHDIGEHRARWIWLTSHRSSWRAAMRYQSTGSHNQH